MEPILIDTSVIIGVMRMHAIAHVEQEAFFLYPRLGIRVITNGIMRKG